MDPLLDAQAGEVVLLGIDALMERISFSSLSGVFLVEQFLPSTVALRGLSARSGRHDWPVLQPMLVGLHQYEVTDIGIERRLDSTDTILNRK